MSTLAVSAGAVSTGPQAGDFAIIQGLNWSTSWSVVQKTGSVWELGNFTTPAPLDGSGLVYFLGTSPPTTGTETLQDYLDEVRRLLHDQEPTNGKPYWSTADLIKDINEAIKQRDMWSGGSRSYQPNQSLTVGQDQYSLTGLFPTLTVLDVINIWLIYGSTRYRLDQRSFTDVTDGARPWTTYQNRPFVFTRYGSDGIFISPKPATAYGADFDLSILSTTLVNPSDVDPLVFPYTRPVPYYACYLACINARRWDLADQFMGIFIRSMRDIEGSRIGEMPMMGYEVRGASR